MMLSGLTSRWMTPLEWAKSRAEQTVRKASMTRRRLQPSGNGWKGPPSRASCSALMSWRSVRPWISFIVMNQRPSSSWPRS